jgi:HEAT repeat protein
MEDDTNPRSTEPAIYNQPAWTVDTVNQTVINQNSPAAEELTPTQLADAETRYRAQVIERYNRLGFAGLGVGDLRLSDVALDDVFVRLTLTVEKTVREPIPSEEWEGERQSRNPFHRGEKKEDERPRKRIITSQESITLGDALTQHALIVGEPGAGKSTLLRWLAVTFAAGSQRGAERLGPQADTDRLPLLVELGRLPEAYLQANSRETPNWKVFLPEHLTKQPAFDDIPAAFLEQALAQGRCLLLCDGLDEIADLSARRRIADSLADYARSSANRLVLSSRPAGVSGSEGALGSRFQRLTIQRFAPEDVRRFFGFWYDLDPDFLPEKQSQQADALFAKVEAAPKTLELATTPLLATLLLLIWRKEGDLPERRVELYERCCQMLIESWEAQHDVAYTGVLAEIGWERHLRLLAPLAYAIHNTGQRTDAPASELIPILAQAMQTEGLATPASATLEAEKFLRTLSLRSGLLQFLGTGENSQGRYGFPHLTFQEYLTARHIAAQPDPDYIDLVMPHLHKAWWREVHLLVIGYLGSGSENADKASRLLLWILDVYPQPWRLLPSKRFVLWRFLAGQMGWQFERRLAWILAREFLFASSGFFDCAPLGVNASLRSSLAHNAHHLLLQITLDPGRIETGDATPLKLAASSLVSLGESTSTGSGQASAEVVAALVRALGDSEWQVRQVAAGSLVQLGQASAEVAAALEGALGNSDSKWQARQAAARSLGQLNQPTSEVTSILLRALNDCNSDVRKAAALSLGQLEISSSDVFDGLNDLLNSGNLNEAVVAIKSLHKLGYDSPKSLNVLLAALDDEDEWIREDAATELGDSKYVSPEVIRKLDDALDDIGWVRFAALESLRKISLKNGHVLQRQLTAINDGSWGVRSWAAQNLGRLGDSSPDVLQALTLALKDESAQVREAAAVSLGLLGDVSYGVEKALIEAIESERGKGSKTILRSLWERDRHQLSLKFFDVLFPETRIHAVEASIWALGELGSNSLEIIERLINVLVHRPVQNFGYRRLR